MGMHEELIQLQDFGRAHLKDERDTKIKINSDPITRRKIERVYSYYFGRTICGTCKDKHLDALIELVLLSPEKIKNMEIKRKELSFKLLPGVLLRDVIGHNSALTATSKNLTDDLALYHLATNYDAVIEKFVKTPDNLEELILSKQQELEIATQAINKIRGNVASASDEAKAEVEVAKAEVEAAKAEAKAAKAEAKAAKAEAKAAKAEFTKLQNNCAIIFEKYGIDPEVELKEIATSKK